MTFIQLCIQGIVEPEQIDDFVDEWHNSGPDMVLPLSEFLGMTDEEYNLWMLDEVALLGIINKRIEEGR